MNNKVLWNNEMDLCIGLLTELDCTEFIREAKKSHLELTGEHLIEGTFAIEKVDKIIWKLEVD